MERETRVRIRGGKWTTRLAFFSFLPSRLFVSGKLKPVDTSNRLRSQPFSSTSNAPFALRCRATTLPTPKLNQEIPFAFRRAYGVSQMEARRKSNHGNERKVSFFFVSKKARPSYLAYICSTAFEMYRPFVLQRLDLFRWNKFRSVNNLPDISCINFVTCSISSELVNE